MKSCKVKPGGGAAAVKKGQQGVEFVVEVLTEIALQTIATEATFTDGEIRTRVDLVSDDRQTRSRIAFEIKNSKGERLNLTKGQKGLLGMLSNGACSGVGKGSGINIDKTFIIKLIQK